MAESIFSFELLCPELCGFLDRVLPFEVLHDFLKEMESAGYKGCSLCNLYNALREDLDATTKGKASSGMAVLVLFIRKNLIPTGFSPSMTRTTPISEAVK